MTRWPASCPGLPYSAICPATCPARPAPQLTHCEAGAGARQRMLAPAGLAAWLALAVGFKGKHAIGTGHALFEDFHRPLAGLNLQQPGRDGCVTSERTVRFSAGVWAQATSAQQAYNTSWLAKQVQCMCLLEAAAAVPSPCTLLLQLNCLQHIRKQRRGRVGCVGGGLACITRGTAVNSINQQR